MRRRKYPPRSAQAGERPTPAGATERPSPKREAAWPGLSPAALRRTGRGGGTWHLQGAGAVTPSPATAQLLGPLVTRRWRGASGLLCAPPPRHRIDRSDIGRLRHRSGPQWLKCRSGCSPECALRSTISKGCHSLQAAATIKSDSPSFVEAAPNARRATAPMGVGVPAPGVRLLRRHHPLGRDRRSGPHHSWVA